LRSLRPVVAPVASGPSAVTRDPLALRLAEAVHDAFGDVSIEKGLTRGEVARWCDHVASRDAFVRFSLFVEMDMVRPVRDKGHRSRYIFNPKSSVALLVFERLGEVGGADELLSLLDRTSQGLRSGALSLEVAAQKVVKARRVFANEANHLLRLVQWRPPATAHSAGRCSP
jgi:hypothetical protein